MLVRAALLRHTLPKVLANVGGKKSVITELSHTELSVSIAQCKVLRGKQRRTLCDPYLRNLESNGRLEAQISIFIPQEFMYLPGHFLVPS